MRKINYILITAPCTRIRYNSYINIHEFQDMMRQQGTYYDFNELLNLEDSLYFYDANHLNQKGVDVFNTKIIEMFFAGSK